VLVHLALASTTTHAVLVIPAPFQLEVPVPVHLAQQPVLHVVLKQASA
jgi:hypothetical protein